MGKEVTTGTNRIRVPAQSGTAPLLEVLAGSERHPRLRVAADGTITTGSGSSDPSTSVGGLAADYEASIERLVLTMAAAETRSPLVINDSTDATVFEVNETGSLVTIGGSAVNYFTVGGTTAELQVEKPGGGTGAGYVYAYADADVVNLDADIIGGNGGFSVQGTKSGSDSTFFVQLAESTVAPSGAANRARIYAVDNGSGKTKLMAIFASGAAQQLAIEP